MIRVEVFQTSDGTWYLQTYHVQTRQVYMLLTFSTAIEAIDTASLLQLRINNRLPLNQYYKAHDVKPAWDLDTAKIAA